eukprot:g3588.t1
MSKSLADAACSFVATLELDGAAGARVPAGASGNGNAGVSAAATGAAAAEPTGPALGAGSAPTLAACGIEIAFRAHRPLLAAFVSFMPNPCGRPCVRREHRLVVLPCFQGLGIGAALSDAMACAVTRHGVRYVSHQAHVLMRRVCLYDLGKVMAKRGLIKATVLAEWRWVPIDELHGARPPPHVARKRQRHGRHDRHERHERCGFTGTELEPVFAAPAAPEGEGGNSEDLQLELGAADDMPLLAPGRHDVLFFYVLAADQHDGANRVSDAPCRALNALASHNGGGDTRSPSMRPRRRSPRLQGGYRRDAHVIEEGDLVSVSCVGVDEADHDVNGCARKAYDEYLAYVMRAEGGSYTLLWKESGELATGVKRDRIVRVVKRGAYPDELLRHWAVNRKGLHRGVDAAAGGKLEWQRKPTKEELQDKSRDDDQPSTWGSDSRWEVQEVVNHTTDWRHYAIKYKGWGIGWAYDDTHGGIQTLAQLREGCVEVVQDYLRGVGRGWDGTSERVHELDGAAGAGAGAGWADSSVAASFARRHHPERQRWANRARECCRTQPGVLHWQQDSDWEIAGIRTHSLPLCERSAFIVRWRGWGPCWDSSEPFANVCSGAKEMLNKYLHQYGKRIDTDGDMVDMYKPDESSGLDSDDSGSNRATEECIMFGSDSDSDLASTGSTRSDSEGGGPTFDFDLELDAALMDYAEGGD